jgi:hypothetical protein
MSETTTPTPKRGRPAKVKETAAATPKPAAKKATPPSRPKIKREEKVKEIREYKLIKKSGATFLMQQKNVMNNTSGVLREIRYCPNEPSIYRDEQNDASVRKAIIFTEGRLFVPPEKPNLTAYLDAHPDNKQNGGNRFYLVDDRKDAQQKLEREFETHDAVGLVRTKELDELLSVAVSYGMNIDRPVTEIKHDLMVVAKKNPKKFIMSFDNPVVDMKTKVTQAIKYQVIKVDKRGAYWYDTGKLIVSVPEGKDAKDVLTRYCLTESGAALVAEIDRQLS